MTSGWGLHAQERVPTTVSLIPYKVDLPHTKHVSVAVKCERALHTLPHTQKRPNLAPFPFLNTSHGKTTSMTVSKQGGIASHDSYLASLPGSTPQLFFTPSKKKIAYCKRQKLGRRPGNEADRVAYL